MNSSVVNLERVYINKHKYDNRDHIENEVAMTRIVGNVQFMYK